MKLRAKVDENGKFAFTGSRAWVLSRLKDLRPGDWDVEFKPHVNQRSGQQNRYYWAVVVTTVYQGLRDAGFDAVRTTEDAHEILKAMFFKKVIHSETHDALETQVSTAKFSKEEFGERIDEIARWAAEYLGVTIPAPNTQGNLYE